MYNQIKAAAYEKKLLELMQKYRNRKIDPEMFVTKYMEICSQKFNSKNTKLNNILFDLWHKLEFYQPNENIRKTSQFTYGNDKLDSIILKIKEKIKSLDISF